MNFEGRQPLFATCQQPILAAIFITIATGKVESIPDLYTLAFVLIN